MSQSLSKIYVHLVFSTKHRERHLPDAIRPSLHGYISGILHGVGCVPIEINSEPDHAHLLFCLGRSATISDVVAAVKKSSNDWLRATHWRFRTFHWQGGYGAFSVGQAEIATVQAYVRNQQQHHRGTSFQDELRRLFEQYHVDFDERYVWDCLHGIAPGMTLCCGGPSGRRRQPEGLPQSSPGLRAALPWVTRVHHHSARPEWAGQTGSGTLGPRGGNRTAHPEIHAGSPHASSMRPRFTVRVLRTRCAIPSGSAGICGNGRVYPRQRCAQPWAVLWRPFSPQAD